MTAIPTEPLVGPPRLRLVPLPPADPPYDDELASPPVPPLPGQAVLALAFPLRGRPEPGGFDLGADDDPDTGALPTPRAELSDPRPWAARFAQAVAEVLAGVRPAGQLLRWTTVGVYDELATSVGTLGRPRRPVLRSVHVCEPADGVAEACARVDTGERSLALAVRFEGLDGRWRATAVVLG